MQKLMIIDDDRTTVGLLQTLLELDGYSVVLVADGAAALAKAKETKPDAFLVDYNLSDSLGTDVIRQLKAEAEFADKYYILTSGMERAKESAEAGANYFLLKPYDPTELTDLLSANLGQEHLLYAGDDVIQHYYIEKKYYQGALNWKDGTKLLQDNQS